MDTLRIYKEVTRLPLGKKIFSSIVCRKAPYFSTISPVFVELKPNYCEVFVEKRRSILNHIGTVHAIAMCNAAELVAGMATDVSLPKQYKWIPSEMQVKYLKKATTSLTAVANLQDIEWAIGAIEVPVSLTNQNGEEVFTATITMHISAK